jgi:potassium/hydrogen antiporter
MTLDLLMLIGSSLILLSIAIARLSDNAGVPVLVLFLGIGMLAGVDGPGGIVFDDAGLTQSVGIICLVFILFAGGLDTHWSDVRPVAFQAFSLATVGVLVTAFAAGLFARLVLGFPVKYALLLGAIISSTDAAAVFSVLRTRNVNLRGTLRPLLELESGSNDPMAVFLTIGLITWIQQPATGVLDFGVLFLKQMGFGAIAGVALGKAMQFIFNRIRFAHEAMYPVFGLAFAAFSYAVTAQVGGSGFLAVYLIGIVAGSGGYLHQKSMIRFFDGVAWLAQISMFLALGLLVTPSRALGDLGAGLLLSVFLMFVARPAGVLLSPGLTARPWRERLFVAWTGLRGAVPVVLATFPLIAGIAHADRIFNLVFFVVLTSAMIQGWSIPPVARLFNVDAPAERRRKYPLEMISSEGINTGLVDLVLPKGSHAAGKSIVELGLPRDTLIVLVGRNETYLVPTGGTVLEEGDTLLALAGDEQLDALRAVLQKKRDDA